MLEGVSDKIINGCIQVKKGERYGFFGMDTEDVRNQFSDVISAVNNNIKKKGLHGKVKICRFDNHDGPHLSLWMLAEASDKTIPSISGLVGKNGKFKITSYEFVKTKKCYLLNVTGI